jgi:hypothetical protein
MRPPGKLVVALVAAALAGAVVFFATVVLWSGDGDEGGRPLRAAAIDDLPHIVLQPEDLPDEYVQLTEKEFSKLKTTGEYGSIASYETAFELPREQAEPGETVCIVSLVALYPSADEGAAAVREPIRQLEEAARRGDEAGSQIQELHVVQPTPDPARAIAARYLSPSTSYCAAYENEPAFVHLVRFEDQFPGQAVVGTVTMFVYQTGNNSDDPMKLARVQQNRMRDWLASTGIESPQ